MPVRCPLDGTELFLVAPGPGIRFQLVPIEDAKPGDVSRRCASCGYRWALRTLRDEARRG